VHVSLSEVLGTMTGACGPYNLGGSATRAREEARSPEPGGQGGGGCARVLSHAVERR
jgi:hypothetical protein